MNKDTERKQVERAKKREAGLIEKTIWVRPEAWNAIRAVVAAMNKEAAERKENGS